MPKAQTTAVTERSSKAQRGIRTLGSHAQRNQMMGKLVSSFIELSKVHSLVAAVSAGASGVEAARAATSCGTQMSCVVQGADCYSILQALRHGLL